MLGPAGVLLCAVALLGGNALVLSPMASEVGASFDATIPEVMWTQAMLGFATALSAVFLAPLSDRFGTGRTLSVGFVGFAFGLGLCALAPTLSLLSAAQGIVGLAAGVAFPTAYKRGAEIAPPGALQATMGKVLGGWTLALVVGVSASAVIADFLHWRAVYAMMAGLGAAVCLALRKGDPGEAQPARPYGLRAALGVPGVWSALFTSTAFMTAFHGLYAYLGAQVTEVLLYPMSYAGLIPMAYGLGFGVGAYTSRLLDRLHRAPQRASIYVAIAVLYAFMAAAADSFWMLVMLAPIWGVVQHWGLNMIVSRMSALDDARRGAILGLNTAGTYLAVSGGALIYGAVFTGWGLFTCAVLSTVLAVLAAIETYLKTE